MRLRHRSGRLVHLSSGIDVHSTRDFGGVVQHLDAYAAAVRTRAGAGVLGVTLWLPPPLAAALAADGRLRTRLRAELDARGLEIHTLSGTPCAGGAGAATSDTGPDWSDPARLEHTLDLARTVVDLLPDDAFRGAVTTVGLGRRAGWTEAKEKASARILGRLSAGLAEVAWHTGRAVRVGLTPEPGGVLDSAEQTATALSAVGRERIGVNLDLANLACTWEEPADALDRLAQAGLSVIAVRVTAALEVADPHAAEPMLRELVSPCDPITNPHGAYLAELPADPAGFPPGPWRIARHTGLGATPPPPFEPTTHVWRAALRHLLDAPAPALEFVHIAAAPQGGAGELAYAGNELVSLGLTPQAQAQAA